jgi:hypothetical protein
MKGLFDWIICITIGFMAVLVVGSGCSKENPLQKEGVWKKVCTTWGEKETDVATRMQTYKRLDRTSTSLCYSGKGDAVAISYKFVQDSLCAAMVMVDASSVNLDDIKDSFKSCEYLGENNSMDLYIDYIDNSLVTISECQKNDKRFYAVSYIALD